MRLRIPPLGRFFLAWALTLGVLVYCWGRLLVFWMLTGRLGSTANNKDPMFPSVGAYTAAVMTLVIWLLKTGNPLGGLVIVPALAVWLRRAVESGRLLRSR